MNHDARQDMTDAGPGDAAAALDALSRELDLWRDAGLSAQLWLRDDDAVAATPALERLLSLADDHGAPLLLAVIPLRAGRDLAARLERARGVTPAVHGAWHDNHAPAGRKAEEMAPERGLGVIQPLLASARARAVDLFGPEAGRWYVPPWNRIAPPVADLLPGLGFAALSTFGARRVGTRPELAEVNATLDIIDWRGGRVGRPLAWLAREAVRLLAAERIAPAPRPLGLLAHHLQHDAVAWESLRRLMTALTGHPATSWRAPDSLLTQHGPA